MFRTSLLGLQPRLRQDVDLAHLAQRRGDDPGAQNALEAGQQVLRPPHTPRIGYGIDRPGGALGRRRAGLSGTESGHVAYSSGIARGLFGCCRSGDAAHATAFRPAALARYSARSADTSRSPSAGSPRVELGDARRSP